MQMQQGQLAHDARQWQVRCLLVSFKQAGAACTKEARDKTICDALNCGLIASILLQSSVYYPSIVCRVDREAMGVFFLPQTSQAHDPCTAHINVSRPRVPTERHSMCRLQGLLRESRLVMYDAEWPLNADALRHCSFVRLDDQCRPPPNVHVVGFTLFPGLPKPWRFHVVRETASSMYDSCCNAARALGVQRPALLVQQLATDVGHQLRAECYRPA